MSSRSTTATSPQSTQRFAGFFQRMLGRLDRGATPADAPERRAPQQPAGHRSGEGSDSILPYLAETRPAPLDD
jgi:hypothetical protein